MNNEVIIGDCLDVMTRISDKSIDMVLTSPPYDNLRSYNGSLDWGEHVWKGAIDILFRIMKDGGVVVWVVGDSTVKGSETCTSFKQALYFKEVGFNLHDTMIYAKKSYMPLTHNRYEQQFEYMFVFSKGRPKTFNPIMTPSITAGTKRNRGGSKANESSCAERKRDEKTVVNDEKQSPNIWFFNVGKNEKTLHNAPFPEELAYDHIISWSNEGDTILDPFAGSGTVGKVAKELNRNYILIEKEPTYLEIINKRLSE